MFPALEPSSGLAMNLLGPLITSRGGHQHVLFISDRFTKLKRAIPYRDAKAQMVSSEFIDTWVAAYGFPDSVLRSNGPPFASVYCEGIVGLLGIFSNYASPYHPHTTGQVERYDRSSVRQLQCYVAEHQTDWDEHMYFYYCV